jgi:hypothetical protein
MKNQVFISSFSSDYMNLYIPMKNLLFSIMAFFPLLAWAQQPLAHEKGSYVDSAHRYYQQASLPLYLYVSHSPQKAPTQLVEQDAATDRPKALEPIYLDGHGKHYIKHTDGVHHTTQNFVVYADGMAPKSSIAFMQAPHYVKQGRHFYGKGLVVGLASTDEMSGVKQIYHTTNGAAYQPYSQTTAFATEGDYEYRFYAVDNVGNDEGSHTHLFNVDLTAPNTYYNVVGIAQGNIISLSTQLYLTSEDALSGVAQTFYKLDSGAFRPYLGGNIPLNELKDGEHKLTFYSIDQVKNQEQGKSFDFYLDRTAPIMSADVLGDKFVVGNKVYFSGRTKLKLTAVDNKAGIKEVQYAIDDNNFKKYDEPFYLPSVAGEHVIRYYALDNMANQGSGNRKAQFDEYRHNVSKVYVDLTGPVLSYKYQGPQFQKGDSVFVGSSTIITLNATDPESGLQYISYSIDGQAGEQKYETPFSIIQSGTHNIEYFGYDNVNNRNVGKFVLVVDGTPPTPAGQFSIAALGEQGGVPVFPSYVTLYLSATDTQTGNEKLAYQINGGPETPYLKPIDGWKKDTEYQVTIIAADKLGNEQRAIVKFRTAKY